ncbi:MULTISPECIES: TRAP transporter substrate-binding protein DctP [unclassified Halomonas]|uniref:TRAP transporter substrate-binding protein n=1 Tax=unclassified Halomonas TaxID=2609666 RepID=UPI002887EC0B|nr:MULTISPECIES: TRAP transporter substrate-binding protein DctP [unclassified Halomonas]MDT0502611.1 TRAP transporter substrate-binding protein DctP [Halomonas sp. PAR7]MDT0513646.1 TRAP transporter substrate-binding protein DctP [Halomonas sp. LES1]MDT0592967.1 TRAP transporter substrate-binding protein DctP [Halomonas sp. PAR8]
MSPFLRYPFASRSLTAASLLAAGLGIAFAGSVQAATTVNIGYNGAPDPDKNAVHVFATNLKELVEEKTAGEIELKLYPNSMLGEEEERMEQVMNTPSLNIASFAGMSPVVPEVFVSAIPFLFDDFEAARTFFDEGEYWQAVEEALRERTGLALLAVVEEGGFLAFTNDERPISSPSDFEGLRFRAMDPSQVALYEAFGASGTPIPWTEVYMALRTGVADGQMNPPMYIILGSLYEVQDYLTLANIQYSDQFLVGNGKMIDGWDEEMREAFLEAVAEANQLARDDNEARVDERIAYLEEQGMEVIRPSEEELGEFRELGQPAYMEWLKERDIAPRFIDMALEDAGMTHLTE